MNVTGGKKSMDAGTSGSLESLGGDINIIADTAGEGGDAGFAHLVGDALNGFKITGRGDRKTGLDEIDSEALELAGDGELFLGVHAAAGRLFTIAQGGVKDENLID
jgi:hypothetical protein